MAGKTNTSATFFAQKKLLGKAHTSNLKTDGEELIGSNIQAASSQLFGQEIPANPSQTLYLLQSGSNGAPATVEYIHFALTALTGTTYDANNANPDGGSGSDSGESGQTSGPHTYKFVFRSDYESNSSNPKEGNGNFNNNRIVHETLGKVQLVPPYFSQEAPNPYTIKIYKDNGNGGIGAEIPLLDNVDWNVDYYNGILFLQDYNSSKLPAHAKAFAYVGDMLNEVITVANGDITAVSAGTGLSGGGTSGAVTLNVDRPFSRTKITQKVLVQQDSNTIFTIAGSDMSTGGYNPSYIDLFLNGQLLQSGSASDITTGVADYTVANSSSVKFSFDIESEDSVTLIVFPN